MVSKSTEIKNLNSRDIPTRRKAVRWLIENDIRESLTNFVKFIDDDDVWFREKAKYVFLSWCSDESLDLVLDLLSNRSRKYDYFISTFLSNFSSTVNELIEKLIDSENPLVRINVRKYQLSNLKTNNIKPLILQILNDPDYRVRMVGVNFIHLVEIDDTLINKILGDNHSKIKLTALEKLNYSEHSQWINKFDKFEDEKIRFNLILIRLSELIKTNNFELITSSFLQSNLQLKRKLVSGIIKLEWTTIKDFIDFLVIKKEWEFLILIVNSSSKSELISLRYDLSLDNEIPIELRLKLIKKLKGRINDIDLTPLIENLEESGDMRLIQEGELLRGLLNE